MKPAYIGSFGPIAKRATDILCYTDHKETRRSCGSLKPIGLPGKTRVVGMELRLRGGIEYISAARLGSVHTILPPRSQLMVLL